MTNREKFITNRDEYDLLMAIRTQRDVCPIKLIGAEKPKCIPDEKYYYRVLCSECVQRWLNEEATT